MHQLPLRVRQSAALALLAVSAIVIALLTVVPFATHIGQLREQIDAERALLGRFAAVASQQGKLADFDRIGRAALDSNAYLKGESEALKAASLQTILAELAGANRIRLTSTRTLPARERNDVRLIGVRVQFNAEIEQLRSLLHRIETYRPFLFVEGLQVQPTSPFSQRDPDQAGILDVRLDVFGAIPGKKS